MSKSRDASLHGAIARCGKLLGLGALASLLVLSAAHAQTKGATPTPDDRGLRLVTLAPIPAASNNSTGGALYSFDISYVDPSTGNYFLADRSNRVVDFVDSIGRYVTGIPASPAFAGFTGSNATSGPNGVVAAFPWLFVTDANSRVVTIDLRNNSTVSNASTGGAPGLRADELAYDPTHGVLLVVNNADTPPFATFVIVNQSTGHLTVSARITFDAAHGVDAQNGAEQPVWDGTLNRFFLTIPQIGSNVQNGGVVRINPFSASVEATYPVNFCGPAGLTLGPNQNLFIGCNMVFDTNGMSGTRTGRCLPIRATSSSMRTTGLSWPPCAASERATKSGSIPAPATTTPPAAAAPNDPCRATVRHQPAWWTQASA